MGTVVSEFVGLLPLEPIQEPRQTKGFFYSYSYASLEGIPGPSHPAPFQFPDGTFDLRRDLDIHNGIPGVVLDSQTFQGANSFANTPVVFDPATIGSGTHNVAALWQQPDGKGNDSTALFVFDLTVGPGVPPQPPAKTPAPRTKAARCRVSFQRRPSMSVRISPAVNLRSLMAWC